MALINRESQSDDESDADEYCEEDSSGPFHVTDALKAPRYTVRVLMPCLSTVC